MAFVLKTDGSVAAASVRFDLPVDEPDVWVTFDLRFGAAALAFWNTGFGSELMVLDNPIAICEFFTLAGLPTDGYGTTNYTGSPANVIADVWALVEVHYENGVIVEVYVDGNLEASGVEPAPGGYGLHDVHSLIIGQYSPWPDPSSIDYYDNVKMGTTRGASDLFSDNFESGDLSAWSDVDGDCTVVPNPFGPPIAPPTQVFGGTRFYEAPPWRIIVGDLEDNTLTFLDRLALDRSVTVTRAAPRVMSGRVPSDNPEVNIPAPSPDLDPFVSEGTRLVTYFRREAPSGSGEAPWVCRARGVILTLDDDADSDHATSTFTAYDPWKYLYKRPMYGTEGAFDVNYPAGTRADEIIVQQMQDALDFLGGTLFTDFSQTGFYTGTIESTEPLPDGGDGLAMTFRAGTTLGEMLDLLVATGTCDVVFDPIYDPVNRPGLLCQMSIYRVAGDFRANAVMGWDRWPRSLVQLSRQVDGTERANLVQMYAGQGGPPVPLESDAASIAKFGNYWALQYLPGVPSLAGAHTTAQRQLALLKDGQMTYALSPASERAPLLFEEYREADTVPVYASDRFRDPISGVPVRIESIPIVIGDDELERVNQMLVSFAPEPGS
jgi:hypothetical protein